MLVWKAESSIAREVELDVLSAAADMRFLLVAACAGEKDKLNEVKASHFPRLRW